MPHSAHDLSFNRCWNEEIFWEEKIELVLAYVNFQLASQPS